MYGVSSMIDNTCLRGNPMLKSYPARLDGSTLRWLEGAPAPIPDQPVMVVVEESDAGVSQARYRLGDLIGKLTWRGNAVLEQRAQRDAW